MARSKGTGDGPKPNIKIASFAGSVTVHGDAAEPQLEDYQANGPRYDIFPGVLSWVSRNSSPGGGLIQASGNVRVFGHGDGSGRPVRQSFRRAEARPRRTRRS